MFALPLSVMESGFAQGKCACVSMLTHRHTHTASNSEPEGARLLLKGIVLHVHYC